MEIVGLRDGSAIGRSISASKCRYSSAQTLPGRWRVWFAGEHVREEPCRAKVR
jgi:hypothetical protein